jgi:nucleotide-binding universal stress UspA family protein
MYTNILVPIAFDADRSIPKAVEVAQALSAEGAKITLLHVMEDVPSFAISYVPTDYLEQAEDAIKSELAALAIGIPGAAFELVKGHAARTIVDWAAEHGSDCIVLASHRPGMQDLLIGSTASQVVRHAKCAVHVIR